MYISKTLKQYVHAMQTACLGDDNRNGLVTEGYYYWTWKYKGTHS